MSLVHFYEFGVKDTLRMSGLPDPALHVALGLLLMLLLAAGLRRSLASPLPLALVALVELLNECADRVRWGSWLGWASVEDVVVTLAIPALLFVVANRRGRPALQPSAL